MAAGNESYEDLVGQILRPTSLSDLKDPIRYEKISVLVYRDSSSKEPSDELEFENIYPFYTVADLSTQIYIAMEEKEEFHPQNQCLLLETSVIKNMFFHLRYLFNKNSIVVSSPFSLIQSGKPNPFFVDIEGNQKQHDITSREFMLLDDVLFKKTNDSSSIYTIHLFLYSDVLLAYPGIRPINRNDWEGMIRVYFPEANKEFEDGSLPDDIKAYTPTRVSRFKERQGSIEKLDQLLVEAVPLRKPGESTRGDAINFANVRGLRFTWNKPREVSKKFQPFRLESVFYDMRVSQTVPYIRYYPISDTPISKIHVEGPLNIPTLEDPSILQRWVQERPIIPEQEFISAKILLRPGSGSVSPLYANLFLFQDGSAMFSIQPNANTKSLTRQGDLYNLVAILNSVMGSIPGLEPKLGNKLPPIPIYSPKTIQLTDAYIVLSLWLEKEDTTPITSKSLMKVLPYFRAFFQITSSPIEEQAPIAYLRYKCVNNFRTPSRDFQFLIRVSDLQKIQGATSLPSLVRLYKEEFDVSDEVAHSRVSTFLTDRERYSVVDPQTLEFTQKENPGIDIAIFGKHPYYTFHIYRVDSVQTLRRIKTLLSLLISVDPETFIESQQSAEVLEQEEAEQTADAEQEAQEEMVEEQEADQANEAQANVESGQNPIASLKGEMKAIVSASALNAEQTNAGIFDDDLGDFDGFGDEVNASQEAVNASQEAVEVPVLKEDNPFGESSATGTMVPSASSSSKAVLPAPTKSKKGKGKGGIGDDEEDDITDISQIKLQPSRIYFRKRLQFYDKTLFSYAKTHPSLKKYPSMCAANALKQPTVMSEDEFERMKDIYSADITSGRVLFIEYPVKKGFPIPTPKTSRTEIITTLRYGSNLLPGQANIYICSEYWCIKDELIVLKDDFENRTIDKKGHPKDKNSCPFCHGGLITNRDVVTEGNTVIERIGKDKESGSKKHLFINFLNKTPHPLGLYLPCCFILNHPIQEDKEPAFKSLRDSAQKLVSEPVVPAFASSASASSSASSSSAASVAAAGQPVPFVPQLSKKDDVKIIPVNYKTALDSIKTTYIVGAEKLPLELTKAGPQIGIVPKNIDVFFTQDSLGTRDTPGLVVQTHTVWKLMIDNLTGEQNASGFFRLAAENNKRNQADSFLAAVAPYFTTNSAAELKSQILSVVQPIVFLSLNYGNFLFDFYNPNTPAPPNKVLRDFSTKRFFMPNSMGLSKESLTRAWKGFTAFEAFIKDTSRVKEYRQFAQIFSTPNLLYWTDSTNKQRMNGILFIVLEVGDDGSVEIRCPPYGVTPAQIGEDGCDVAFILHYYSGVWEPLFYTNNDPVEGVFENTLIFTRDTRASWPKIVEQRVNEYERMCHSSGLGMYTDSPFVEAKTLLPISKAMTLEDPGVVEIHAIMRDSYNHISSIMFKVNQEIIIVPVIDDGTIYMSTLIELEWKTVADSLAKTSTVREFYETKLAPLLDDSTRDTYEIVNVLRLDKTEPIRDFVYAFQLKGGLYVPVKKGDSPEEAILESTIEGSELPWSIDRKIAFGKTEADVTLTVDYKEFEEIYQHLRFTFANWFSLASPALKTQINSILYFNGQPNINIPLYEKRQRLLIILQNEILGWLDSTIPLPSREPSLKRIDCRVSGESQCKDRCVWKGDSDKCLLHVPTNFDVGSNQVPATTLLVGKLIEELVRFPQRRKELLEQDVGKYVKIFAPFRSGDQYIIPEDLPAWSEMLRMDWLQKDEHRYIEEYSAISPLPETIIQGEKEGQEAQGQEKEAQGQEKEGQQAQEEEKEEEDKGDDIEFQAELDKEEELEVIKSSEIPILDAMFGHQFFFIINQSVTRILNEFGMSNDEFEAIGQTLNEEITDLDIAQYVSQKINYSLYQLIYSPGNPIAPTPLIVKLRSSVNTNDISDVVVIVKLPDGRVGLLSSNTKSTPITFNNMKGNVKFLIKKIHVTEPDLEL